MYSRPEASCHAPADWLTGLPVAVMSTGKPAQAERGLGQGAPDEIRRWRPAGSDGRILIVATRVLADEGNVSRLACVFQYFRQCQGLPESPTQRPAINDHNHGNPPYLPATNRPVLAPAFEFSPATESTLSPAGGDLPVPSRPPTT